MMKNKDNTSCRELTLKQTARYLKKHDNYIILTHASPDGDTLGSAYALYYGLNEIGKTACVLCPDVIPNKYDFFVRSTNHVHRENATIVAVDIADKKLLGALADEFGDIVDLCIDHHITNGRFAKNLYLDTSAGATAESIFELLTLMRVNINDITACALYAGIATDTGCFKYSNVTAKTHIIAAMLYDYNINAGEINRLMFDTKSKNLLDMERRVLEGAEYHFNDKCIILSVTSEMQEITGCYGSDLEGIALISRSVEGIDIGITVKQVDENSFKVSFRTFERLNAAEIAKQFGGGGHKAAAAAVINGSLAEVKAKILEVVAKAMEDCNAGTSVNK
ncbi:MAG: bifunctional oligoribonuclease/PAP phosphatase NrnA [Clostridia bacterium]|nr:bifunctional oligoribonuclease/PAP phosphatase NrnA [Clostridia bacterium]